MLFRSWVTEVRAWRASGLSADAFCKDRGYSASRLYNWSSRLNRANRGQDGQPAVAMARVVRRETAASERTPIVIQVGHARVEVTADSDPDALSVVLRALASVTRDAQS